MNVDERIKIQSEIYQMLKDRYHYGYYGRLNDDKLWGVYNELLRKERCL